MTMMMDHTSIENQKRATEDDDNLSCCTMDDAPTTTTTTPFSWLDLLSGESLSHVVSYCDFANALMFARATSRSIREELYRGDHFLWKEIFRRHYFSLPPITTNNNNHGNHHWTFDYLGETRRRRQLARNLLVPKQQRSRHNQEKNIPWNKNNNNSNKPTLSLSSSCFNLPNRCFYFVPITPDDLFAEWDDPPPVDFGCDSFILTSAACGSELLFLDPFHGSLTVFESCLDNAVASNEGMMENAMLEAANLITDHQQDERARNPRLPYNEQVVVQEEDNDDDDWREEQDIAGAVFDQSVYRNHNVTTHYKKPPFLKLFRLEDDIDLEACFPPDRRYHHASRRPPIIDVGYHGIDAKSILNTHGQVVGNMIAVGRMLTKTIQTSLQREEQVCTELICWTRMHNIDTKSHSLASERTTINHESPRSNRRYGKRTLCRFPRSFSSIDVCPTYQRVYVSFDPADGSADPPASYNPCTVVVFPMVEYPSLKHHHRQQKSSPGTNFQQPEFLIHCGGEVSALTVGPMGDCLMVGTSNGTCEVWRIQSNTYGMPHIKRTATIRIESSIARAFPHSSSKNNEVPYRDGVRLDLEDSARMQRKLLAFINRPKIVSFHHPSHCSLSTCGFVTLQHSASKGSSLLLWRKNDDSKDSTGDSTTNDDYRPVSIINLPLSGMSRAPRVVFDGRKILVLGQDQIGVIILVYHVLSSNEDIHFFQQETRLEETSGGVYNLTTPSRARFANRIRHAALGGLQYYDSIHMTCNDRFIVVNTKAGNLLSDFASAYAEGLLVIDLHY